MYKSEGSEFSFTFTLFTAKVCQSKGRRERVLPEWQVRRGPGSVLPGPPSLSAAQAGEGGGHHPGELCPGVSAAGALEGCL